MHSINKLQNIQNISLKFLSSQEQIIKIVGTLHEAGATVLLVGGAVRDLLLGLPLKDFDIEVHRIMPDVLQKILGKFGHVRLVGKQFGVFKIDGINADWSLPRTDSAGRKPEVTVDPNLSYEDAFGRRDVTINAMGLDLISGDLIDPYNGRADLENKILRAPRPEFFVQDPLRFFRIVQFIGRFNMTVEHDFEELLKVMSLEGVSQERITAEYEKLFLLSERPSAGLRWMEKVGRLQELLPELAATVGIGQRADYHPEGDVFEHTMQAVDAMAEIVRAHAIEKKDALLLLIAIVCHDLGKVTATRMHEGRLISWGHEIEGVEPAERLCARLTLIEHFKKAVGKLVRYHMMPGQLPSQGAKEGAYKRLAHVLAPQVTPYQLALLSQADKRGRNGKSSTPLVLPISDSVLQFMEKIRELGIVDGPEKPILHGADILDVCDAGPALGKMLEAAYTIQIEEGVTDKKELKQRVSEGINKK